jgi:predicted Zn-dependent protease
MSPSRIEALREIVDKDPEDALARFMLARELFEAGDYEATVAELETYLKMKEDEGAAYRMLGDALVELGKKKEAQWAFRHGIEAARTHGLHQMAEELEQRLREVMPKGLRQQD